MVAKEVMIANIKRQKDFIMKSAMEAKQSEDGDPSFPYIGYIYPEVKLYFEVSEGLVFKEVHNEQLMAKYFGRPVWCIMPQDKIELNDEERKQAEEYCAPENKEDGFDYPVSTSEVELPDELKFLEAILGGQQPGSPRFTILGRKPFPSDLD